MFQNSNRENFSLVFYLYMDKEVEKIVLLIFSLSLHLGLEKIKKS